jgi:hypothetical protein
MFQVAHEEGLRAASLEHRVKIMEENEKSQLLYIQNLEKSLQDKEQEIIMELQHSQANEQLRSDEHRSEMMKLNDKIRSTQEKYVEAIEELKRSREEYDSYVVKSSQVCDLRDS